MAPSAFNIVLGTMLLFVTRASCVALAAWWTELSPHVTTQDPATGNLLYSACNSNTTPIFPTDGLNTFKLQRRAQSGTSLAAAGWYDTDKKQTMASVFYQIDDGSIANGYFACDMDTGHYYTVGEYTISVTAKVKSVHPETGLAVELLGAENGYRVFFHDENKMVNSLSYTTKTNWRFEGRVSQDQPPSTALTSVHSGQLNMSVIFPKDSSDLEVSRYFKDETWRLYTFPRLLANSTLTNTTNATDILFDSSLQPNFTLPAWRNNLNLSATIDQTYVRSIFYIGTDAKLHQTSNIDYQWKLMPDQDSRLWPVADEAGGALAATSNVNTNEEWLWYRANGSLVQLYRGPDGLWAQANVVPSFNATKPAENPTETAPPRTTASPVALSTGAKAGIGIAVSASVIALAGVGILLFVRRRRQHAIEAAHLKEIEAATQHASPGDGGVGPYTEHGNLAWAEAPKEKHGTELVEADAVGRTPPQELASPDERYELVGEGHWREMDATGQNGARRSIGGWRE